MKNLKTIFLILAIVIGIGCFANVARMLAKHNYTERIEALNQQYDSIDQERILTQVELVKLQVQYDRISGSNDSLKGELNNQIAYINVIEKEHQEEIDRIKKIPPDTVYKILVAGYPNTENLPLLYPFSGPQITSMYSDITIGKLLESRYNLQKTAFNDCQRLNTGYESEIFNLQDQKTVLSTDIRSANSQIAIQNEKYSLLETQYNRKKRSGNIIKGVAVAEFVYILVSGLKK